VGVTDWVPAWIRLGGSALVQTSKNTRLNEDENAEDSFLLDARLILHTACLLTSHSTTLQLLIPGGSGLIRHLCYHKRGAPFFFPNDFVSSASCHMSSSFPEFSGELASLPAVYHPGLHG